MKTKTAIYTGCNILEDAQGEVLLVTGSIVGLYGGLLMGVASYFCPICTIVSFSCLGLGAYKKLSKKNG